MPTASDKLSRLREKLTAERVSCLAYAKDGADPSKVLIAASRAELITEILADIG